MAGPQLDASGVSRLVRQLRTASATGERNMTAVSDLLNGIEEIQEQVESGFESFQADMEELRSECERLGDDTVAEIQTLTEAARAGAEEHLPTAVTSVEQAMSTCESSYESDRGRLEAMTESLRQEGFEELSTALSSVREEDTRGSSELATALSALEEGRDGAQQSIATAESEAVERCDGAVSALDSDGVQELETAGSNAVSELQAEAGQGEQGATQIGTRLQGAYNSWSASEEGERESFMTALSESLEQTAQNLVQKAETQLHEPCDRLHQSAVPQASGELESTKTAGGEWSGGSYEVSTAANELDTANDAKERIDRLIESGT